MYATEKKLTVTLTLPQLDDLKMEVWRFAATSGQEDLIKALSMEAWLPDGHVMAAGVNRGDLSDEAWSMYQRIAEVLRKLKKPSIVRDPLEKEPGA